MRVMLTATIALMLATPSSARTFQDILNEHQGPQRIAKSYNKIVHQVTIYNIWLQNLAECTNDPADIARAENALRLEEAKSYDDVPEKYKSLDGIQALITDETKWVKARAPIRIATKKCRKAKKTSG